MRVLMTGGGTGGHVNPAIAIANTIKKYNPDATIEFVASTKANDKACDLVPRAGYKLHRLDIRESYGIIDPRNIKTLFYMIKASAQAKKLIESFKPDVIIGTGGYACFPLLKAGAAMGIPTAVHESNAVPGKAVKMLCRRVDCVMTNYELSNVLKGAKRLVRVGNPMLFENDAEAVELSCGVARSVVCFGGSGGAKRLNEEMCRILPALTEKYPKTHFCLAAGMRDYPWVKQSFEQSGILGRENVELVEYIYDMKKRMAAADLMICRAGAMTVSELALMGKAAIFVPFPYAAANHQYGNAKAIADKDGCELVTEDSFASDSLTEAIEKLLMDADLRMKYSKNIKSFATDKANDNVYAEILKLLNK